MSDSRGYGIDMVPATGMAFRQEPADAAAPVTESERCEMVNADILRRICLEQIDEFIARIRNLPPDGPYNIRNLVQLTAQELEAAAERYLEIERRFRNLR